MKIRENMTWPPASFLDSKLEEHSVWYSGDPELLANYYSGLVATAPTRDLPYDMKSSENFWGRQIKNQGEIFVHVPIAGDIAETSANLLFSEAPIIRFDKGVGAEKGTKRDTIGPDKDQVALDTMLAKTGFFSKLLEGAEICAALGGVFIKLAWDKELSDYPIPVVHQPDRAIPEFSFGILKAVTFWKIIGSSDEGHKVYRLLERYSKGAIENSLFLGSSSNLGKRISLQDHEETAEMKDVVQTVDELCAVYVPNMLPNRLQRTSYLGRSDLSGLEGLMDCLDEAFSGWAKEITLGQAKVFIPESYLQGKAGNRRHNVDKMLYEVIDVDPVSDNPGIIPQQFEIRADAFEKTTLNYLDRIITSAGYSPQSFGLAIQGRAESGLALQLRERKSFATKAKKEKYWMPAIEHLVKVMCQMYVAGLGGKIDLNKEITVSFSDGIMNNFTELSSAVAQISSAMAASTETKVRLLHPEWDEAAIEAEVAKIIEENNLKPISAPDMFSLFKGDNPDMAQMNQNDQEETEEEEE